MRVLLAGPDFEENLSIRYLSASLLEAGHETVLAAFNSAADIPTIAEAAQSADLIGLSMCFQSRAQEFLQLAMAIKAQDPSKLIVAGGHYASCAAQPLLLNHAEIDIIVVHEGEKTLLEIGNAMARSNLPDQLQQIEGIAYRDGRQICFTKARRTLDGLDSLPFPDRRGPIHVIAGVPTSYLMGSRGCHGNCAYCCITTLHRMAPGKRFRQRNVERIADEMAVLYHERGTRQFIFHDDNFLVPSEALNHARIAAFEKELKERGLRDIALVIKCRPADANRNVLRRLKELGLVRLFLGVESATEAGLSDLERRQSVEDSIHALEVCSELELSAQFTIMIFHPDATLATMQADSAFMRRFCRNPLNFCRAEIYAGTPLERRMIAAGRARGNYLARVYDLADPIADRACKVALDLFEARCWNTGSLMQNAIGLDHTAAVFKRFHTGPHEAAIVRQIAAWLRAVNIDTIGLLDEMIDLCSSRAPSHDAGFRRALGDLHNREAATRQALLCESSRLRAELERLRSPAMPIRQARGVKSRLRFGRQAAVAVLALGLPAAGCNQGVSEMAPPPLKDSQKPPQRPPSAANENLCSLVGTVTDPAGAVITNATITITNVDTGQSRAVKRRQPGSICSGWLTRRALHGEGRGPGFQCGRENRD